MNLKNVEKKEKNTAVLTVEVTGEEFDKAIEKVYKATKSRINVPGFRKGKAPRKIVEAMYGATMFYEDAINDIYPEALTDAVKAAGLEMVGYPQVEMDGVPGPDGFVFNATIGLKPVAKLGEYKGLAAPKASTEVTEADIEAEMKPLVNRATHQEEVERPVQDGDTAVIDFEGFKDGVPFEGGKAEEYPLEIGSGSFIPGFEEQLIGMSIGEEKEINVTFPEDYGMAELAGQPVVFKVKVHEVKESVAPELDDEFAKDVSEFDTLEELKADLSKKVAERKEKDSEQKYKDAILNKLIDNMEVEIPDTMVEFEADQMIENYAARFRGQEFTFEQYLQMMGTTMDQLRVDARAGALREIQSNLAYAAVAEAEGMEASDEDVAAEISHLATQYGMKEEDVKARIPMEDIKNEVLLNKARDFVYANAVVAEPETAAEAPAETEAPAEE